MRHPFLQLALSIAAAAGFAAAAGAAATDPIARHAALVAEGQKVVAQLVALEQKREAYDRDTGSDGAAKLQAEVDAQNKANAVYADAAKALAADVKAHNAACGAAAAKTVEAATVKDKKDYEKQLAEREALKKAEAERVAKCDAEIATLDQRGKDLDAQRDALLAQHADLERRVKDRNASIDQQEALGEKLNDEQSAAEDEADRWLERFNAVIADKRWQRAAEGVQGCKARREMMISGKDLKVFIDQHATCAKNLAR